MDTLLLVLRVWLIYPLGGLAAGLSFVSLDETGGKLIVDLDAGSAVAAAAIYGVVTGGGFAWSRWLKARGGVT